MRARKSIRWAAIGLAAFGTAGLTAPVQAATPPTTIFAADPEGIVKAMAFAGFEAELDTDKSGDPMIRTDFGTGGGFVYFYGCDEKSKDGCDAVQFVAGLDREQPMPADMISMLVNKYRYVAISLDDEGDPRVTWDIVTGEGIDTTIFVSALRRYSGSLDDVADAVFAEEREKKPRKTPTTAT